MRLLSHFSVIGCRYGNRIMSILVMNTLNHSHNSTTKPADSQQQVIEFLMQFQNTLTECLTELDGQAQFKHDNWNREQLGNGSTRVVSNGRVFEQGGVNFSQVRGTQLPPTLLLQRPHLQGQPFWAAGVSLVLHPINPYCPTVHLNYRYFESGDTWWFGGGSDLTPYYPYLDDCQHWHRTIKQAMDPFDPNYYPAFSYWCDEYFYNHHRNETRGIGGSFYDYQDGSGGRFIKNDSALRSADKHHPLLTLEQQPKRWESLFAFQQANANAFIPAYQPIIERRHSTDYTEQQRQFQLYRRGRYVEFNLLHDRGTLFGIQSGGRTESILMSLPPLVRWEYGFQAEPGTPEHELTRRFLHRHQNWIDPC